MKRKQQQFAPGYNVEDHKPTCDILTTRDGWEADCTCGAWTREPYERPQVTRVRLDDAMMVSVCKGRPRTPNSCHRRPGPPLQGLGS